MSKISDRKYLNKIIEKKYFKKSNRKILKIGGDKDGRVTLIYKRTRKNRRH